MCFSNWLNESNLDDLYDSTVRAFPRTTKRQYAIDPIKISEVSFTPFLGVRTLFVKALAQNQENGNEYNPMILFKGINYSNKNETEIKDKNGKSYFLEKVNLKKEVLIRCNCSDFFWRFNYFDHTENALYGRVRKKYESDNPGIANPLELPGMCKHLIKLVHSLNNVGILEN